MQIQRIKNKALKKPVWFSENALNVSLWRGQKKILRAVRDHRLVSVRTGHMVGKTFTIGCLVPWFLFTHPLSRVPTTSSSWPTVTRQIWPEIRKIAYGSYLDAEILEGLAEKGCSWTWDEGWDAFGVSTRDPENFGGYHAKGGLLTVIDEASHVEKNIYDAIMSGGGKVLMIGNPLRPSGPFYNSFKSEDWHNIHISSYDTPNVEAGEEIVQGLATREWIEERKRDWGEDSPTFASHVLGTFPDAGEDTLISLDWVERAKDMPLPDKMEGPKKCGVDVARFGSDRTVLIWRDKYGIRDCIIRSKQDTMQTAGLIKRVLKDNDIPPENTAVDDSGLGGGVTDRLHEQDVRVNPVNFGEKAIDDGRFINRRVELYWMARDMLKDEPISMAGNEQLAKELTWPRYDYTSKGKLKLEPKQKIKDRQGESPDIADAFVLTYASRGEQSGMEVW